MPLKNQLSEIPLFKDISDDDLTKLLNCLGAKIKSYDKGNLIILEQEKVNMVGIVMHGVVEMIKEDIWGHKNLLVALHEGELLGEMFAIQKKSESYVSFYSVNKTEIMFLPAAKIIHNCPSHCPFHEQIIQNFFNLLGLKSVQLMEKIEISSSGTTREKILRYLSLQAQKQGSKRIKLSFSKSTLAEYLGVNRSAMVRELSKLKDENVIEEDGDSIIILKADAFSKDD